MRSTAMDLGARRLDLIGMKFSWPRRSPTPTPRRSPAARQVAAARQPQTLSSEISGNNGRCQDLRDAYSAVKGEYSQVWLGENRPYWLNNVTVRYDLEIQKWQQRADHASRQAIARLAQRQGSASGRSCWDLPRCRRLPGI